MYVQHFGLSQRPFATTADTANYYPSTCHELALGKLRKAVALQDGFAVLTAEPGLGKSLLAYRLLASAEGDNVTLMVNNTSFDSSAALFQTLLFDLGQPYEGKSEQELRLAVIDRLLGSFGEHKSTLLIVDEAHHLPAYLLEELRLLGNLESREGKAVQVVLIGLPGLQDTLGRPDLAALRQRVRTLATLSPFDSHEGADYVSHLVRAAGGRSDRLFTEEALQLLARGTRGVPRLLNQAADQALQLAALAEEQQVDAEAALEALGELSLALDESSKPASEPAIEAAEEPQEVRLLRPSEMAATTTASSTRPRRLFMTGRRSA
jgi:type II secretory pathway predicted ATPase ExeA